MRLKLRLRDRNFHCRVKWRQLGSVFKKKNKQQMRLLRLRKILSRQAFVVSVMSFEQRRLAWKKISESKRQTCKQHLERRESR